MISKKHLKISILAVSLATTTLVAALTPTILLNQNTQQTTKSVDNAVTPHSVGDMLSQITPKTGYPKTLQVQEVMDVINPNNTVIDKQLETYFNFVNIPANTLFEIQANPVYDYAAGKVSFKLRMSQYYIEDATGGQELVTTPSTWIDLSITVNPRLTIVTQRTNYFKIGVDKLEALIFDNGTVVLNEIIKFVEIQGRVPNSTLYLKNNSYVTNTGMGTAKFTMFFDKYYKADGTEGTNNQSSITQPINLDLSLLPMTSVITSKEVYTPSDRVDQFIDTITDTNGNVDNRTTLEKYVEIKHLPDNTTLKIEEVNIIDLLAGTISFNVVASQYNNEEFVFVSTPRSFPIQLQLTPKYPATNITAKAEGSYDDEVRVDRFIEKFATNNVVTNLDVLGQFVDLVGVLPTFKLTIEKTNITNATGVITFDIVTDKYYDTDSTLVSASKSFSIRLELGIKHVPTTITGIKQITNPERIDLFETKIKELDNTKALETYLVNHYITISGDVPENLIFRVGEIDADYANGLFDFKLIASHYYDPDSDLREDGEFSISIMLKVKYPLTELTLKASYDQSERIDYFIKALSLLTNNDLKNYISPYVDGLKTLVNGFTLSAVVLNSNLTDGTVQFKLITNKHYDIDSNIIYQPKEFIFDPITLTTIQNPTTMVTKTSDFSHIRVDQFTPLITVGTTNEINMNALSQYVTVANLPPNAKLTLKDANPNLTTGVMRFKVVTNTFFDIDGDLITNKSKEFVISLNLGIKHQPTVISVNYDYVQTENVNTFVNQLETLTGANLITYLETYLSFTGEQPTGTVITIDQTTIKSDATTGKVTFSVLLDQYYGADSSLQTNGVFTFSLILAH